MGSDNDIPVAVITGASSGIGLAAAKALAAKGWRIVAHGRDAERCRAAQKQIAAVAAPGVAIDNLSLVSEAASLAAKIAARTDRVDVLLNNAGGVASAHHVTVEGNEATFAGNYLGHFVLTSRLIPFLNAAASLNPLRSARIINVASSAHEYAPGLDRDDLQSLDSFEPNFAYCKVKLANILFTKELSRRLSSAGIVAHAMHPGSVDTKFFSYGDENTQMAGRTSALISPDQGADTAIWLATNDEPGNSTGGYWHERKQIPAIDAANDPVSALRLREASEKLVEATLGRVLPTSGYFYFEAANSVVHPLQNTDMSSNAANQIVVSSNRSRAAMLVLRSQQGRACGPQSN